MQSICCFRSYCSPILLFTFFFIDSSIDAQTVTQSRGVDKSVDYDSLKDFGPWDDRNYQLTKEDLALLSSNEHELKDVIPAFYRVHLRKTLADLLTTGPVQYPRSALQYFNMNYGGYLIDDQYYNRVKLEGNRYRVMTEDPIGSVKESSNQKMATSEVRISSPVGAAESAIKIHPLDPNIVIAGSNGPGFGQKMHYSHDGGLSWTQVNLPLGGTCCDPTVDYSSDGQFAYTATLGNGVWFYRSSDNGVTWTDLETLTPGDPRREMGTGGSDKEFLHVDKHCTSPYQDNIYMTWHEGNTLRFSRSTDMGNTWDPKTSFSSDPSGIGSDIITDADGNIYYIYASTEDSAILLKKSTNGGVSFIDGTVTISVTEGVFDYPIPAMSSRRVFIYAAADVDLSSGPYSGSIYASWTDTAGPESNTPEDNHSRIQVGYSRDQGETWTVVTPHEIADVNTVDRFHQWIAVGVDGTVHVVYYDTRNSANRDGVDFYHSFSTDGAQTFSAPERLTTITSGLINNNFEWGDYNGMDHVVRQSTIFTDNRDEDGSGGDSEDIYSTTELQGGANYNVSPAQPSAIFGPKTICEGQTGIPYEVPETTGADTFDWSFSDSGVTISGNGNQTITLDGITASGGILTVVAQNICGEAAPIDILITIASTEVCEIANCIVNSHTIDNPVLATNDIFDIIQDIMSDATVSSGSSKVFRAGTSLEFIEGFTVEQSSLFIAQIEDCTSP